MGKIVSRNVVSQSKEDVEEKDPNKALTVHYCLCGEFLLVLEGPLTALPQRPTDGAYALRNSGPKKRVYKLNAEGGTGRDRNGVLLRMGDKTFEYQRKLFCTRCRLPVGYETKPGEGQKGEATFLYSGGLSDTQAKIPEGAFGPDDEELVDEKLGEKESVAT